MGRVFYGLLLPLPMLLFIGTFFLLFVCFSLPHSLSRSVCAYLWCWDSKQSYRFFQQISGMIFFCIFFFGSAFVFFARLLRYLLLISLHLLLLLSSHLKTIAIRIMCVGCRCVWCRQNSCGVFIGQMNVCIGTTVRDDVLQCSKNAHLT